MSRDPSVSPLRRYVATLAVAGVVALVASWLPGAGRPIDPVYALALTALGVVAATLPIRIHWRSGIQAFTLEEGVFVAMLFTLPAHVVPALMVVVSSIGHTVARREPLKVAFNAAQVALWSAAGTVAFHLIHDAGAVLTVRGVLAATAATAALNVVSLFVVARLFHHLEGRSLRDSIRGTARLNLLTWLGNTVFGLVAAALVEVEPWSALLAFALMLGQFLGFRGYSGALEERARTDRLHSLSGVLASTITEAPGDRFLSELADLFGAASASLVLVHARGWAVRHHPATGIDGAVLDAEELVRSVAGGATRLTRSRDGRAGSATVLAAPLRFEDRTVGAVAVHGRLGFEDWDDSDLTLLAAVANETVVALRNAELFADLRQERERLAARTAQLTDIVEATSDGIVTLDRTGDITVWNDAMSDITGTASADVLGRPWFQAMRLRTPAGRELTGGVDGPVRAVLDTGVTVADTDLQILRDDGEWRWLRCSIAPIPGEAGTPAGAVLVGRDVTREREVQELKNDFTATVSHELRTPLTPLRGFLDTLRARGGELDDDQRDLIVGAMSGQVARLEGLVGDLLAVAAADRGLLGLQPRPVDLVAVVDGVLARDPWSAQAERVVRQLPDRLAVIGDEPAVARIVSALIDNGLKHTAGPVQLRAHVADEWGVLEVIDTGPGIPARERERIFERFARLGDHLHRVQGPGLGLSIARAYARELGGDILVGAATTRGSVFSLRLPLAAPKSVPDGTTTAAEPRG